VDQGPADELHGEGSGGITAETGSLPREQGQPCCWTITNRNNFTIHFKLFCTYWSSKSSSKAELHSVCISLSIYRQTQRQKTLDLKNNNNIHF